MTGENRRANSEAERELARDALAAAKTLADAGLGRDAMSRLYFAAFHTVSSALLALGIEVTSHRALTTLFALHLIKPGHLDPEHSRRLAMLQGLRHEADYNRHLVLDLASVRREIEWVCQLAAELERFLAGRGLQGP